MKKSYLVIAIMLVLVALLVCGCGTTTIYQQAPTSVYTSPITTQTVTQTSTTVYTSVYTSPITTIITTSQPTIINTPTPPATTFTAPPNQIFNSGSTETLPSNGVYLQAGQTLTLSWSADGNLTGYIFSSNQFNNWQSNRITPTFEAGYSGSTYSFSYTVQNADTCYAVLYDSASVFGNSVRDYQFTLTVQ